MRILKKIGILTTILMFMCFLNNYLFADYYNDNTLFGSYKYKSARAERIEGSKHIIIGGSASNLGFSSKEFEELSGKPAVNLSISAGVPLRVYMKAAENVANRGDTIIMVLEYDYYSDEFSAIDEIYVDMVAIDENLKCSDSLIGNIEYCYTYFLRSFTRLNDCFLFLIKNILKTGNTIYIADSVDLYGDFLLHQGREASYKRIISTGNFSYNSKMFDEIVAFIERMEEKGIKVYLSYPPMDGYCYENYIEYFTEVQKMVESSVGKKYIIGTPFDFMYDEDFFFDTVYHIKYENREVYTNKLYEYYKNVSEE